MKRKKQNKFLLKFGVGLAILSGVILMQQNKTYADVSFYEFPTELNTPNNNLLIKTISDDDFKTMLKDVFVVDLSKCKPYKHWVQIINKENSEEILGYATKNNVMPFIKNYNMEKILPKVTPRPNIFKSANLDRIQKTINAFMKRTEDKNFKEKFKMTFDKNWWNKILPLCITETELDFPNKVFNTANYGIEDEEDQISFDINCTIATQIVSKFITQHGFKTTEDFNNTITLAAF